MELKDLLSLALDNKISIFEVLNSYHNEEDYINFEKEYLLYQNDYMVEQSNDDIIIKQSKRARIFCYIAKSFCKKRREAFGEQEFSLLNDEKVSNPNILELSMDWDDLEEPIKQNVESTYDGLVLSLTNKAKVDIGYIAKICGITPEKAILDLRGLIYLNPEKWNKNPYIGWETSDEYLSGLMSVKLQKAMEASKDYPFLFRKNVLAINKIYPDVVSSDEIYVALGSPWVPTTIIDNFVTHLLGSYGSYVKHDNITGTWEVPSLRQYYFISNRSLTYTWGTKRCNALRILENSLNLKKPMIYDQTYGLKSDGSHGDIYVLNKEETALAQEKQKEMAIEFQKWIWSDSHRKQKLLTIYEDKYSSYVRRKYDGSFLTFPGMSDSIKLFDYQKNAVARILFSKNVLLAHDVGSGKTYEMIAAGMELKRIGISKKILYVVPNNIVGQWSNLFKILYPKANVLVVEPKSFTPNKRQNVLKIIKNEEFDGIIMAYSCFDLIPLSIKSKINSLENEKENISAEQRGIFSNTTILSNRKKSINKKLLALREQAKKKEDMTFDKLDIDRIFLDEAHNYKNVPIQTKMSHVLGVNATGSKKCQQMLDKIRFVQSQNNGGGIVMATGTPITNSITEAYILQLYLQPGELNLLDLQSFDAWVSMFAEVTNDFEIDVTTNSYRLATRFSKFHNLPELTSLLSSVADFHKLDKENGLPTFNGYIDIKINKTDSFTEFLGGISKRADMIRSHLVSRDIDNMLKITTDGRKAALDLRLIDNNKYFFYANSKVAQCAKNVFMEYCSGCDNKTTQLIFCDSSTPKETFNMYDELSRLLINMGIKAEEIAYIHDATTEKKRASLYEKVRNGEIRILIGSTFKLGLGVNVQDKAKALHHLDIPWRPADMTQREGRILRQGNTNESINIYRYVTEGSFDAYSWQLLETKQKFINDLLSGSLDVRDGDEIDSTVLSYGEIKALAIGNPIIKERTEIINEITRLKLIQSKKNAIRLENQRELLEIPSRINIQQGSLDKALQDYEFIKTLEIKKQDDLNKEEKDNRKDLRDKLDNLILNNVLMPFDRVAFDYYGFKVILPKDMTKEKPFLMMQRNGNYKLDMSDSKTGNLIRIDNFVLNFEKTVNEFRNNIKKLKQRKEDLESEIVTKDNTYEQISELKKKLIEINERLGLKNEK